MYVIFVVKLMMTFGNVVIAEKLFAMIVQPKLGIIESVRRAYE